MSKLAIALLFAGAAGAMLGTVLGYGFFLRGVSGYTPILTWLITRPISALGWAAYGAAVAALIALAMRAIRS